MTADREGLVLVVDDDVDIARFIEMNLVFEGFEVAVAYDGQEALTVIEQRRPDLVLLDVMMPLIDGVELCRKLRADPMTAALPVIMLTAKGLSADKVLGLTAGADDYIIKPFDTLELIARVRSTLRRNREMRDVSPLTGLPGNTRILGEIAERFAARAGTGAEYAVCYVDLDHFKTVNDVYGFFRGDQMIATLATALHEAVVGTGRPKPFLGHIGGDDFIVACTPEQVGPITERAIAGFAASSPALYDDEDAQRGYFEVLDRQGRSHRHGLLTVSIGVALSTQRTFTDHREVVAVASEMKQVAKRSPGSVVAVDRRREREPGRGPAARTRAAETPAEPAANGRAQRRAAAADADYQRTKPGETAYRVPGPIETGHRDAARAGRTAPAQPPTVQAVPPPPAAVPPAAAPTPPTTEPAPTGSTDIPRRGPAAVDSGYRDAAAPEAKLSDTAADSGYRDAAALEAKLRDSAPANSGYRDSAAPAAKLRDVTPASPEPAQAGPELPTVTPINASRREATGSWTAVASASVAPTPAEPPAPAGPPPAEPPPVATPARGAAAVPPPPGALPASDAPPAPAEPIRYDAPLADRAPWTIEPAQRNTEPLPRDVKPTRSDPDAEPGRGDDAEPGRRASAPGAPAERSPWAAAPGLPVEGGRRHLAPVEPMRRVLDETGPWGIVPVDQNRRANPPGEAGRGAGQPGDRAPAEGGRASRRAGGAHSADPDATEPPPNGWASDPDRRPATPAWEP